MSKRSSRKYGISRRIGAPLWGSEKDPYHKRNYPPGMHGPAGHKKPTEYGSQLLAKQQLKKYYGDIREKQFKSIYKKALRKSGDTGENLVGLLESRLDAFVYRSQFARTIFSSRQYVTHKHVKVNGIIVNIPSYVLKVNDVVEIRDTLKKNLLIKDDKNSKDLPSYIQLDTCVLQAKLLKIPSLSEVPYPVQMTPNLVVEFYSR